jgi:hypothetical protein
MTFEAPSNSFFTIALPQYISMGPVQNLIHAEDIISLSVIEELGKSIQGIFQLYDPEQIYAKILRLNTQLVLSWGYKANGAPVQSLFGGDVADVFTDKLDRRGIKVLVLNPSGEATADGVCLFSCGFLSMGWFGSTVFKTFSSGTKYSVVNEVLNHMGVSKSFVKFDQSNDSYSEESVERQYETDFSFLCRISYEWRCVFQMGYTPSGETYAAFYGFAYADAAWKMISVWQGRSITSPRLSWKYPDKGDMNVISYTWRNEAGESGEGDNVRMTIINGVTTFQRFTIENEKVVTWTLNTEAVKKYVDAGNDIKPILSATDFGDPNIRRFWTSAEQTTAPNGLGYTITLRMLGNPAMGIGQIVTFNKGFPPNLCLRDGAPIRFIVRKITHTIGMSGYFMDVEVVDILTISAVGVY